MIDILPAGSWSGPDPFPSLASRVLGWLAGRAGAGAPMPQSGEYGPKFPMGPTMLRLGIPDQMSETSGGRLGVSRTLPGIQVDRCQYVIKMSYKSAQTEAWPSCTEKLGRPALIREACLMKKLN